MKKFLTIMAALLVALGMQAYDYPYLSFQTSEGTVQSVSVNELIITFSNGQLVLTNAEGTESFTLSDLSKMYFSQSNETAGIAGTDTDNEEISVFTIGGLHMGTFQSVSEAKASMKPGIYVMKTKSKTLKTIVK
jgi:hypothetical protein